MLRRVAAGAEPEVRIHLPPAKSLRTFGPWTDRRCKTPTALRYLGHRRKTKFSLQQREELGAIIHLCGAGPAKAFARRGFRLVPGEGCGDHDVSAYLDQINAMKRQFLHLAAER